VTIIVTGAASGLGAAIVAELRHEMQPGAVLNFDHSQGHDVRDPARTFGACPPSLDVLVNCAGINKTNWLADVADADWDEVMDVNAKGIFKMSQWALSSLRKTKGTIVNIVSNASHMPMRCSAAYNASKGAAHILTLQLARELSPDVTVFGISPNKLAGTGMRRDIERQVCEQRGWTPEQAAKYQLAALLPGVETPPERVAEFIAFLLSDRERHRYLAGCVIPYGA